MAVSKTLMRKSFMIGARYSGLANLAAPFLDGCGAIFMLHRVGNPPLESGINGFLSVKGEFLQQLLIELKQSGLIFVSMDETIDRLKSGHKDEKYSTVTLDDGYRDNLDIAAPIFSDMQVPYTIYACTGFASAQASLWWEIVGEIINAQPKITFETSSGVQELTCQTIAEKQRAYGVLANHLISQVDEFEQRQIVAKLADTYGVDEVAHGKNAVMNWDELRTAAKDPMCTIGAHTLNHYALARLSREDALNECVESARILENELGERPRHFAYPYGGKIAVGERETQIAAEAGFTSAVTTRHGLLQADHKSNLFALPRISLNGEFQRVHYVKTMLSGFTVPVANRGKRFVTV